MGKRGSAGREASWAKMAEEKERRTKAILEYISNSEDGVTVTEISVDLKLPYESARKIVVELRDQGAVYPFRNEGKSLVYIDKARYGENAPSKEETQAVIEKRKEELTEQGGKMFEEIKPAIHVNQGEVIWIQSRSGDGAFFRYLIITPWERKATVVGLFAEGHPMLNVNDPRFVDIGTDPESGEELYADVSNFCSRAYAQFGERLMTVDEEHLEDVKKRIARYHRLKLNVTNESDAVIKLKGVVNSMKTKMDELNANDILLKDRLKAEINKNEELNKLIDKSQQTAKAAIDEVDACHKKLDSYSVALVGFKGDIEKLTDENKKLYDLNKSLEEAVAQAKEPSNEDMDALLWKISLLEKELECKNETIVMLKQIVFKSLKGGE